MTDENDFAPHTPEELPSAPVPTFEDDGLAAPATEEAPLEAAAEGDAPEALEAAAGDGLVGSEEAAEEAPTFEPLPTHWVNFVPEGVEGLARFDKLTLTNEEVNGLIALGVQLCMEPHLPVEVTTAALIRQSHAEEGELVLLEIPEGTHPEHVARIEAENANRRAQHEADAAARAAG